METKTINSSSNGQKKQWSRASLVAAVASGALTVEAANLILHEIEPNPEPIPEIVPTSAPDSSEEAPEAAVVEESTTATINEPTQEPSATPEPEPIPEPIPEPMPEPDPEPIPDPEDSSNPHSGHGDTVGENLVDVIVEEVDPNDNDMADIINVDEIGTVYTTDGQELTAALIHDPDGGQALLVDVDGDNVYDVITTETGEVIAQANGDIDVSDVEHMYAAQHGDTGYLASNDFDHGMTTDTGSIQDDIQIS